VVFFLKLFSNFFPWTVQLHRSDEEEESSFLVNSDVHSQISVRYDAVVVVSDFEALNLVHDG
jgi:hypothetical protein